MEVLISYSIGESRLLSRVINIQLRMPGKKSEFHQSSSPLELQDVVYYITGPEKEIVIKNGIAKCGVALTLGMVLLCRMTQEFIWKHQAYFHVSTVLLIT